MKIDPFAPDVLEAYGLFCRKHGYVPYPDYLACWEAVETLIADAEAEGSDPFALTPDDVFALLGQSPPN